MNNKTKNLVSFLIHLIIFFLPTLVLAQGGPGGGELPGDPGTPIDGGASLLAGAAAVYGVKKLRDKKNTKR